MRVDMGDYESIKAFADNAKAKVPVLDYLLLNTGIGGIRFKRSPSGRESMMQVNYLSNVLLIVALLPHLETNTERTGTASRITWVGSRRHHNPSFALKAPIEADETVLGHMDDEKYFFPLQKYNDTKTLCAMFLYDIAPCLNKDKVCINQLCPGAVDTAMGSDLPLYLRIPVNIMKTMRARTVEKGAWVILNAMLVAGPDSHGRFLLDKNIEP